MNQQRFPVPMDRSCIFVVDQQRYTVRMVDNETLTAECIRHNPDEPHPTNRDRLDAAMRLGFTMRVYNDFFHIA